MQLLSCGISSHTDHIPAMDRQAKSSREISFLTLPIAAFF
jgi:hypothetical protein